MIALNNKIVAYLSVNNIGFVSTDYVVIINDQSSEEISYWNEQKLGPIPTQQQMDDAYPIWEAQQLAAQNKAKAQQLLADTDWTATVDINNPQYSNPYLANQDAFLAYRSAIRAIAVNPPAVVDPWPTEPDEVWETVSP
jgi:hypothetical protein